MARTGPKASLRRRARGPSIGSTVPYSSRPPSPGDTPTGGRRLTSRMANWFTPRTWSRSTVPTTPQGSRPRAWGPGLGGRGSGSGRRQWAAPSRRGAPPPRGWVPGSDSMGEDPGDHGDDPHQPLAPGTGERIDLEDAAEELRPAESGCAERPVHRLDDRDRRLGRVARLPPPRPGSGWRTLNRRPAVCRRALDFWLGGCPRGAPRR